MYDARPKPTTIALSGLLLTALSFYACATTGVNQGDFNLLSIEEEWQLGAKLEKDLAQKLTLVDDQQALAYVDRLGQRIVDQTEMADLPWKFHIVADPQINAFNIPGGQVYVNTGLLEAAPDVAALAGVMAHEISHGVARHGTEQLTRSYGLSIVAGLVLGENPATYQEILAQVLAGGALARFSREAEREADILGVKSMYAAGYDPRGMARMFEVLLEQRQSQPNAVERFFSSHPLTEDRIQTVRAEAAKLPPKQLINSDPAFRSVQQQIARYNR